MRKSFRKTAAVFLTAAILSGCAENPTGAVSENEPENSSFRDFVFSYSEDVSPYKDTPSVDASPSENSGSVATHSASVLPDKTDVSLNETFEPSDGTSASSDMVDAPSNGNGDFSNSTDIPPNITDIKSNGTETFSSNTDVPANATAAFSSGTETRSNETYTPSSETKALSDVESAPQPENGTAKGFLFEWNTSAAWEENGRKCGTVNVTITNSSNRALNGWTVRFEVPDGFTVTNSWNGTFTASGTELTVENADYNGSVPIGANVTFGFNYSSPTEFAPAANTTSFNGYGAADTEERDTRTDGTEAADSGENQPAVPSADVKELLERSPKAKQGDDWLHTDGNRIVDKNGKEVWLTGVNWFGYNTGTNTFDGLWSSELRATVKSIADHGFNLIRVPISAELLNQWADGEYPAANYNRAYNEELNNMNSLEIFDYFLKLAEENGIKVMPDIHSAETDAQGHNAPMWYTDRISAEEYYAALEWLSERYKDNDTIIAVDLKNEPHGKPGENPRAVWNGSEDADNWKYAAETAAKRVLAKNPNLLIVIEGTEIYSKNNGDYSSQNGSDYYFNWWGGNLRGVKDYPIDLGEYRNKVVYSPHDYGPAVYRQPWFQGDFNYDSLIADCWRDNWLYISDENIAPLLVGEWGGFMSGDNLTWLTCMRRLIKEYRLNHTFWCLNANSGDTGGLLLDNFTEWDNQKYQFVKEVLWQENGKFIGLDHEINLGENGSHL